MIAVLDAAYSDEASAAACVLAAGWDAETPLHETLVQGGPPAPYQPGAFYRRELPLLLAALGAAPGRPEAILVDGYVWLDAAGRPGLGARLHEAVGGATPVVGLAKTRFGESETFALPVLRGRSRSPLFVTAAGLEPARAADLVRGMRGPGRLPTLVLHADRAARRALAAG